jgi:hypothetical protein
MILMTAVGIADNRVSGACSALHHAPAVGACGALRAIRLADIWSDHLATQQQQQQQQPGGDSAAPVPVAAAAFVTDVALQTQRLTLDIVGLTAFSHDFGQVRAACWVVGGGAAWKGVQGVVRACRKAFQENAAVGIGSAGCGFSSWP